MIARTPALGSFTTQAALPNVRARCLMPAAPPTATGRTVAGLLRLITALQTTDAYGVFTPEAWQPGQDVILSLPMNASNRPGGDRNRGRLVLSDALSRNLGAHGNPPPMNFELPFAIEAAVACRRRVDRPVGRHAPAPDRPSRRMQRRRRLAPRVSGRRYRVARGLRAGSARGTVAAHAPHGASSHDADQRLDPGADRSRLPGQVWHPAWLWLYQRSVLSAIAMLIGMALHDQRRRAVPVRRPAAVRTE